VKTGWSSKQGACRGTTFVIELAQTSQLDAIALDNTTTRRRRTGPARKNKNT
jgi:hypothetical protein